MTAYIFCYLFTEVQNGSIKHSWWSTSVQSKFPPWFLLISHYPSSELQSKLLVFVRHFSEISNQVTVFSKCPYLSRTRVLRLSFFLMWVGPYTWQLLIMETPQLSSRTYICFIQLMSNDKFCFKSVWFLKNPFLFWKNVCFFKLTWYKIVGCGNFLEAPSFGHLFIWFYYIKLLPVSILVVLWEFFCVTSSA